MTNDTDDETITDAPDDMREYRVKDFNAHSDKLHVATCKTAIKVGEVQDRGFIAGFDHHWTPSSAKSTTNAGKCAQPAVKEGGLIFPGRKNGHGRNHLNIGFRDSLEPMTLSIREGRPTPDMLTEQLSLMDQLGALPSAFVMDKDYANQFKTAPVRRWADSRKVPVVTPLIRHAATMADAKELWDDGDVMPLLQSNKPLYYKAVADTMAGFQFTKLYFFSPDKKLRKILDPKGEVTQFIDDEVYVFILYVNVEVQDADVAWWLYNQYSGRWGILEAYFRALVYEATKSQAQSMFWKNWWYLMATLALNSKATWRLVRRRDLNQPGGWTKELDYQQFLVAARANIEHRFNKKAVKDAEEAKDE